MTSSRTSSAWRLTPLLLLLLIVRTVPVAAQNMVPFTMAEGLDQARTVAHDSIGSDAYLEGVIAVAVIGDDTWPAIDMNGQTAAYWSYAFFSPSRKAVAAINVTKSDTGYGFDFEGPESTGETTLDKLDLTAPYGAMSMLPERLATDPTFQRFHDLYPTMTPWAVQFTPPQLPETIAQAAPSFPRDQQVWQVVYQSQGGDELTCVVASKSGEVFCLRQTPAGVEDRTGTAEQEKLTALPNPATGLVRVELPSNTGSTPHATAVLYNLRGELVRDLSDELARNGGVFTMVDTRDLPDGLYICRAMAGGWSGSIAILVQH